MSVASIEHIRYCASRISDNEMRAICLRIVDEVSERLRKQTLGDWTLLAISKWVDKKPQDEVLQQCVQLLSSKMDAKLFDMHFLFFDPSDGEAIGEPVEDDEVAEAYKSGFLIDPQSGQQVSDFENALVPYFVLSKSVGP